MTKLNVELLNKAADLIEETGRFRLDDFIGIYDHDRDDGPRVSFSSDIPFVTLLHNCNTVGCFAGWILAAAGEDRSPDTIATALAPIAAKLAGLDMDLAESLFFGQRDGRVWDGIADEPFEIDSDTAALMLRQVAAGTRRYR